MRMWGIYALPLAVAGLICSCGDRAGKTVEKVVSQLQATGAVQVDGASSYHAMQPYDELMYHLERLKTGKEKPEDFPWVDKLIQMYVYNRYECKHKEVRLPVELLRELVEAGCALRGDCFDALRTAMNQGMVEKALPEFVIEEIRKRPEFFAAFESDSQMTALRLVWTEADVKLLLNAGAKVPADILLTPKSAKAIKLLLKKGADAMIKSEYHETPLFNAISAGAVEALVKAGVDVNAEYSGMNALYMAQNAGVAEALLKAGVQMKTANRKKLPLLCYVKDAGVARVLIKHGADVNEKTSNNRTPLHFAENGAVAKVLIEAGADVNAKDNQGNTPLCTVDNDAALLALIEAGADVNAGSKYQTPLYAACRRGSTRGILALLKAGARPTPPESDPSSLVARAAIWGAGEEAIRALIAAGADIPKTERDEPLLLYVQNCVKANWESHAAGGAVVKALMKAGVSAQVKDKEGHTPLHYAKDAEAVQALLAAGGDVNARTENGETPLIYATALEQPADPDAVLALIAAGSDVKAKDNYGHTALHWVNSALSAKALLDAGADPNARSQHDDTPLSNALKRGRHPGIVRTLMEGGAKIEAQAALNNIDEFNTELFDLLESAGAIDAKLVDSDGRTWLMKAVRKRAPLSVVQRLIRLGVDVNAVHKSESALHVAAETGQTGVVRALIAAGADVNIRDDYNNTPLHGEVKSVECAKLLLEAGADPMARNKGKQIPLHCRTYSGRGANIDVVRLLLEAGADPDTKDNWGKTPADRHKDENIRKLLNEWPRKQK